jgi:hypothetical protein
MVKNIITKNKEIIGGVLGILLVLTFVNFAMADSFCKIHLGNNQYVPVWPSFVSHSTDGRFNCENGKCTCKLKSGVGYCTVCTNSSGWYASDSKCKGDLCTGGGIIPTEEPLTLVASFPFSDGGVFTKQSFFMNIQTNKIASISLIDNIKETQINLCPNCASYQKTANFKQGLNNITIRAVKGLEFRQQTISFFIDKIKPRITKTLPASNKYANGDFSVYYDEANVKKVELNYGTQASPIKKEITGCPSGKAQSCIGTVDLTAFDGKEVYYWFSVTDIANIAVLSKPVKVFVDKTFPDITKFDYKQKGLYVTFNISVNEKNFNKILYYDNDDPRAKILCSSLTKGTSCVKKISFKKGLHNLDVRISDKAGNVVSRSANFTAA